MSIRWKHRVGSSTRDDLDMSVAIILVGFGHAGELHTRCYRRLSLRWKIRLAGVVDPDATRLAAARMTCTSVSGWQDTVLAPTLPSLAERVPLDRCVVDICAPTHLHLALAKDAIGLGARYLLVEKPLAHTPAQAWSLARLPVWLGTVHNYVYSPVTLAIQGLISTGGLQPTVVRTAFHKDRRLDSTRHRGFYDGRPPHVFLVEMPHQLSIARALLGPICEVQTAWAKPMLLNGRRLRAHGGGYLEVRHLNGSVSSHDCDLRGSRGLSPCRQVEVRCQDGTLISGLYPTSKHSHLQGMIELRTPDGQSDSWSLKDDSLTYCLATLLLDFVTDQTPLCSGPYGAQIVEVIAAGIDHAKGGSYDG